MKLKYRTIIPKKNIPIKEYSIYFGMVGNNKSNLYDSKPQFLKNAKLAAEKTGKQVVLFEQKSNGKKIQIGIINPSKEAIKKIQNKEKIKSFVRGLGNIKFT